MSPDDRRASLLRSARHVFARVGYHQAGVSDIINEAGVARGTFYNYFESKRAVFQAVLEGLMDEVWGVVRPIDIARPIPDQVRANLRATIVAVMAPDVARLLFAEAVGVDEEADAALLAFYDNATSRAERALRLGQGMGIVRDGNMALAARCLLGLIKEPVFQATLRGSELDIDALVDEIFLLVSRGVLS